MQELPAQLDPQVQRELLAQAVQQGIPEKMVQQEIKVRLEILGRLDRRGIPAPSGLLDPRAILAFLASLVKRGRQDKQATRVLPARQAPPGQQDSQD